MDIHLELHANRIWMASEYRGDIKARAEGIPGAGWAAGPAPRFWARSCVGPRTSGVWTYPMNYRTCLDLRREFGDDTIRIGPTLTRWAAAERQLRTELRQILAMPEMPTPRLEREYPELARAVHNRPYQSVGIAFACKARRAVLGDSPGLGKTIQAAGAAVELGLAGPCLVLAPTSAISVTWPDEFGEWLRDEPYWQIEGSREQRAALLDEVWDWTRDHPERRGWAFCNVEMLQKERRPTPRKMPEGFNPQIWAELEGKRLAEWDPELRRYASLFAAPWASVFVDESHRTLSTRTSNPKDQPQVRSGAQRLLVRPRGLKLALSGTPWRGSPLNSWGTLNWLYPEQHSGYWTYVNRWFEVIEPDYGYRTIGGMRPDTEAEFGVELDRIMIRRTKAEVAPDLPPKQYAGTHLVKGDVTTPIGIWLPMRGEQRRAYEQMVANAMVALESGTLLATGIFAELTRCKQLACSLGDIEQRKRRLPPRKLERIREKLGRPLREDEMYETVDVFIPLLESNKWDWMENWLEERGIAGPDRFGDNKVVVASQYTSLINMFAAELKARNVETLLVTGATRQPDRRRVKTTFQGEGGPRVLLINTKAGGTSLTLDAADDMILIDETWNPDDQEQLEDRIHRVSRTDHDATYWYLRSRDTIDERIALRNAAKDDIQKHLMDGRRGVEYAKKLLVG